MCHVRKHLRGTTYPTGPATIGLPAWPWDHRIFTSLFSEEEAKVALGLTFAPLKVKVIAERAEVDSGKAAECLESLANKGVVFANEKDGVMRYALQPSVPLLEASFWKGRHDETTEKLAALLEAYGPVLMRGVGSAKSPFLRSIPVQEEIENNVEVLLHEKLYELVDRAQTMSILHCYCRESHNDPDCHAPREACIMLDAMATFTIERGFGRPLSRDEAKQKIREADEADLVHMVSGWQDHISTICACCGCCCGVLRALREFGCRDVMRRSAFFPMRDPARCKACRKCADKRCPMSAIEITTESHVVNAERCVGCGLCATGCPNDAISMKRNDEVPTPPANVQEWGFQLLMDHGRLEKFMELMAPKARQ